MPAHEVDVGERDVALDHVERRVPEDPLEAEHVATIDQVAPGEGVAERVWAQSADHADPGLQPPHCLLDAAGVERPASAEEERRLGRTGAALPEVAHDRCPSCPADGHDALLCSLAPDLERAIGPQVAQSQSRRLGHPQAGVEQEQQDGPVADTCRGEQATHRVVADWLDELVGNAWLAQRPQCSGPGELLGRQPVAEDLERPDVARDADRRERRAELEQP